MLRRVLIFGNSGSGKSTLAKQLCHDEALSHLDLDTLAWQAVIPPERNPLNKSQSEILAFIDANQGWVIEGCYSDLLEIALPFCTEIIWINLPLDVCIENAKNRPWEPHKYESKAAQDDNLDMLIEWISQYSIRQDTFSKAAHQRLYERYSGKKHQLIANE